MKLKTPTAIRLLVFQPTRHVVWLSNDGSPPQGHLKRIPISDYALDYRVYHGVVPSEFNYYNEFKNYQLVKSSSGNNLELGNLPDEFKGIVQLLRAKCYAIATITSSIRFQIEKGGLFLNPLIDTSLDINKLANIYQRQCNISFNDAKKLVQFKQDELVTLSQTLKYEQIEAELIINNATSVDEVLLQNSIIQSRMGLKDNVFNIASIL